MIHLSPQSWCDVRLDVLSLSEEEFKTLWDTHPLTHHKVLIHNKLFDVPRFQELFSSVPGAKYAFSGTAALANPAIPDVVQRCFDMAKEMFPDFVWNGALVNWYADGKHYIGSHSDDERALVAGAPILSFSVGGERTFRIKDKTTTKTVQDIVTKDGSVIIMGGAMQREFKHEITKTAKLVAPRINITVRSFKFN
jgi:alkylated DNA repair dioxygenase AlkB